MSRIALSSVERAQREILPLDLALYHAARDYPGGAAAIAATTGRNATTLQHKLSPTHPSHSVNIQEFGEILELTKDRRILDAVHALVGDTTWQELAEAYTNDMPETLTTGIAEYFRQVADLAETWAKSIGDGVVTDHELAAIRLQVFRGIQGLLGMFNRATYVNQTTRGCRPWLILQISLTTWCRSVLIRHSLHVTPPSPLRRRIHSCSAKVAMIPSLKTVA